MKEAKDKEPLMSFNDWFHKKTVNIKVDDYAKYHTEWHLKQCGDILWEREPECFNRDIDKQSITNAIENYIKENL